MVAPTGGIIDRILRLHSSEILIFVILIILLGICIAAASLITDVTIGSPL
jgi:hypothetical protein